MKRNALVALTIGLSLAGCSSGGDPGNVDVATKAAKEAPKSPDQLPTAMPPEARASAAGAIQHGNEMANSAQDPARVRAMQEMQKQRR